MQSPRRDDSLDADTAMHETPPLPQVGLIAATLGVLAATFGFCLMGLTLAGAIAGIMAIGFFDICVGGMIIAFSMQSMKFGYEVAMGRQTITGEIIRA